MGRILLLASVVCASLAQDPPTTFRSETRFINVDVQVLSHGKPVTGLVQQDFRVFDAGKQQPITNFGAADQLLDVLLALDVSGSTMFQQDDIRQSAAEAVVALQPDDRIAVTSFNNSVRLVTPPTSDLAELDAALKRMIMRGGGTELNRTTLQAALYLRKHARPGARLAMVILTDNDGYEAISREDTRNGLWELDVVVNLLLFPLQDRARPHSGDIRKFVAATGGEVLKMKGRHLPLEEMFRRVRERYSLLYRAPDAAEGEIRTIKVELRDEVRRRLGDVTIRARSGYRARGK